jgi:hypothetical protein
MPLPGFRADGRRTRDRPGLPPRAPPQGCRRAGHHTGRRALRLSADVSGVARAIFAWAFPSFPFRRPSQRLKGVCLAWKPGGTEMFHRREDVWLVAINIHCHGCAPVADLRRSRLGELHGPTMRSG